METCLVDNNVEAGSAQTASFTANDLASLENPSHTQSSLEMHIPDDHNETQLPSSSCYFPSSSVLDSIFSISQPRRSPSPQADPSLVVGNTATSITDRRQSLVSNAERDLETNVKHAERRDSKDGVVDPNPEHPQHLSRGNGSRRREVLPGERVRVGHSRSHSLDFSKPGVGRKKLVTHLLPVSYKPDGRSMGPPPPRNIFISGLPLTFTNEQLREYFEEFGNIASANIEVHPHSAQNIGLASVTYAGGKALAGAAAKIAVSKMNGQFIENCRITVECDPDGSKKRAAIDSILRPPYTPSRPSYLPPPPLPPPLLPFASADYRPHVPISSTHRNFRSHPPAYLPPQPPPPFPYALTQSRGPPGYTTTRPPPFTPGFRRQSRGHLPLSHYHEYVPSSPRMSWPPGQSFDAGRGHQWHMQTNSRSRRLSGDVPNDDHRYRDFSRLFDDQRRSVPEEPLHAAFKDTHSDNQISFKDSAVSVDTPSSQHDTLATPGEQLHGGSGAIASLMPNGHTFCDHTPSRSDHPKAESWKQRENKSSRNSPFAPELDFPGRAKEMSSEIGVDIHTPRRKYYDSDRRDGARRETTRPSQVTSQVTNTDHAHERMMAHETPKRTGVDVPGASTGLSTRNSIAIDETPKRNEEKSPTGFRKESATRGDARHCSPEATRRRSRELIRRSEHKHAVVEKTVRRSEDKSPTRSRKESTVREDAHQRSLEALSRRPSKESIRWDGRSQELPRQSRDRSPHNSRPVREHVDKTPHKRKARSSSRVSVRSNHCSAISPHGQIEDKRSARSPQDIDKRRKEPGEVEERESSRRRRSTVTPSSKMDSYRPGEAKDVPRGTDSYRPGSTTESKPRPGVIIDSYRPGLTTDTYIPREKGASDTYIPREKSDQSHKTRESAGDNYIPRDRRKSTRPRSRSRSRGRSRSPRHTRDIDRHRDPRRHSRSVDNSSTRKARRSVSPDSRSHRPTTPESRAVRAKPKSGEIRIIRLSPNPSREPSQRNSVRGPDFYRPSRSREAKDASESKSRDHQKDTEAGLRKDKSRERVHQTTDTPAEQLSIERYEQPGERSSHTGNVPSEADPTSDDAAIDNSVCAISMSANGSAEDNSEIPVANSATIPPFTRQDILRLYANSIWSMLQDSKNHTRAMDSVASAQQSILLAKSIPADANDTLGRTSDARGESQLEASEGAVSQSRSLKDFSMDKRSVLAGMHIKKRVPTASRTSDMQEKSTTVKDNADERVEDGHDRRRRRRSNMDPDGDGLEANTEDKNMVGLDTRGDAMHEVNRTEAGLSAVLAKEYGLVQRDHAVDADSSNVRKRIDYTTSEEEKAVLQPQSKRPRIDYTSSDESQREKEMMDIALEESVGDSDLFLPPSQKSRRKKQKPAKTSKTKTGKKAKKAKSNVRRVNGVKSRTMLDDVSPREESPFIDSGAEDTLPQSAAKKVVLRFSNAKQELQLGDEEDMGIPQQSKQNEGVVADKDKERRSKVKGRKGRTSTPAAPLSAVPGGSKRRKSTKHNRAQQPAASLQLPPEPNPLNLQSESEGGLHELLRRPISWAPDECSRDLNDSDASLDIDETSFRCKFGDMDDEDRFYMRKAIKEEQERRKQKRATKKASRIERDREAQSTWQRPPVQARSPSPELDLLPPHKTGSARTEGYYKVSEEAKAAAAKARSDAAAAAALGANAFSSTTAKSAAKVLSRANRIHHRQLLAANENLNDSMKFNQLKGRRKRLRFAKSSIHDWGLFAMERIDKNEFVIEYIGEIVREKVADHREKFYEKQGIGSSYLFRIDGDHIIDATKRGNMARFINHNCEPNCSAKIITVGGKKRIVIYANREIVEGEEITYDYQFPIEDEKIPCLCGAPGCRGTLN